MSISDRVLHVLATVSEFNEVLSNPDLPLFENHVLDSIRTVELMIALSDELGIEISPAEFEPSNWATPAQIVRFVEARVS